jgi:hypothetical protein
LAASVVPERGREPVRAGGYWRSVQSYLELLRARQSSARIAQRS